MVTIVRRRDIPEVHHAVVDGRQHDLGILKDFRWHPGLADFIPGDAKLSLSWVHLDPGQVLDPHVHPVGSMILVCQGEVETLGELEQYMSAGDALLVPPGHRHGFRGAGADGFWGLSVQFEPSALYNDAAHPQVRFDAGVRAMADATSASPDWLVELLDRNEGYLERFASNPLFAMARLGRLDDEETRSQFLDHFQVWSDAFQRMLFARVTYSDDAMFRGVATEHLEEEFGHNTALSRGRVPGTARAVCDAILDATCEWFVAKMLSLDNNERTVLVHLVVEASAAVFYAHMGPAMAGVSATKSHFDMHAGEIDHEHVDLGIDVLRKSNVRDAETLFDIQRRGWDMLNTMFSRIAEILDERRQLSDLSRLASGKERARSDAVASEA